MSLVGLKPQKYPAGEAQQRLKTKIVTSRQRGRPKEQTRKCKKKLKKIGQKFVTGTRQTGQL
jgi:hypothetical protein